MTKLFRERSRWSGEKPANEGGELAALGRCQGLTNARHEDEKAHQLLNGEGRAHPKLTYRDVTLVWIMYV